MNIFWVFCVMFMSCFEIAKADTGLESMLMNSLSTAKDAAKSEASGGHVVGISAMEAEALGEQMSKMTDSDLKQRSHQRMQDASTSESGTPAESIIMKGASRPPDQSLESHSMFVRAEEILKNPMLEMQHLTLEDCRVLTNEEQNHYTKRIIVEEKETLAREKRTCEQPANNIVCEKTLTVSCIDTEECKRGGIVAGSLASNIYMHVNYPNISLGTTAKIRAPGRCEILDRTVSFHLKSHELISDFRITNISYSDWIRIRLNGVQVYNTTGGDGPFKMEPLGSYWPEHHRCGVRSGVAVVQCNTFDYYNIYPNIDLKPYLKEGENILQVELAFGRNGQLYMNLRAKQRCCSKTSERWSARCWAE